MFTAAPAVEFSAPAVELTATTMEFSAAAVEFSAMKIFMIGAEIVAAVHHGHGTAPESFEVVVVDGVEVSVVHVKVPVIVIAAAPVRAIDASSAIVKYGIATKTAIIAATIHI